MSQEAINDYLKDPANICARAAYERLPANLLASFYEFPDLWPCSDARAALNDPANVCARAAYERTKETN